MGLTIDKKNVELKNIKVQSGSNQSTSCFVKLKNRYPVNSAFRP